MLICLIYLFNPTYYQNSVDHILNWGRPVWKFRCQCKKKMILTCSILNIIGMILLPHVTHLRVNIIDNYIVAVTLKK